MIPKVIHYCWFGGNPKPELALQCIESWKKFCPDYKIVEWNEEKFDIHSNPYVQEAYEVRKFAFVTDYVRLYAMFTEGGIYMDTDVMVLKNLDSYLKHSAFSGFESKTKIPTGIMAAEKGHPLISKLLDYYNDRHFLKDDKTCDMTTNVEIITSMLLPKGFVPNGEYQEVDNMAFYPQNVFCPEHKKLTNRKYMLDTATIHYFAGSWKSAKTKKRENSWWWKCIAVPGMAFSKALCKIFGDRWTVFKNRLRDKIFKVN